MIGRKGGIRWSRDEDTRALLRQYSDDDFSYTDAVSFAAMRRTGIMQAFGFDQHFTTAGLR